MTIGSDMGNSGAASRVPARSRADGGAVRGAVVAACLALTACAGAPPPEVTARRALVTEALPPMKTFAPAPAARTTRPNAELARDFLDLSFRMESGRALPIFTRFDGPLTVRLQGAVPPSAARDLDALIARLRAEAGIDLRRVDAGRAASITVDFIPRATLQRQVPQAACFVVPNVDGWRAFRAARRSARLDWAAVERRDRAAVFIPSDTSPQEIRDCLHEELAQALGPLNDLYRLSDSVFNDDNFHTVLTGFDMLMLRVYNHPDLRNGMTRAEVAARLPALLDRINPAGRRPAAAPSADTPRTWISAIETALGPRTSVAARRAAAQRAVTIAERAGWRDARMAFSWFAFGRLALAHEGEAALAAFTRAAAIYATLPDTAVHIAHLDMQMAAFALTAGQPDQALALANRSLSAVSRAENAALLATLLMIKAEALELLGRPAEARAVRLDSMGWARYGFGSEDEVRARLSEIAVLSPRQRVALAQ